MSSAAIWLRRINLSLIASGTCGVGVTGDIEIVFSAVAQNVNDISGKNAKRKDDAGSKVEVTIGAECNISAASYSE